MLTGQPERNGKILRFGVFELDAVSADLTKNGTRVRLQDQPARLLLHLLEHRGEVVTREQLHRALWPADTFVDFDHGLNTAVSKIRDVLGDSSSSPRFVETVPRKGYRFIAPVEEVGPVPVVRQARPKWIWAAAGLFFAAAATIVWLAVRSGGSAASEPVVSPLTALPGQEFLPSLSPDGDRVAFMWEGPSGDNHDIWVKQVGSEQMLRITTDPARESSPAWSPDGRWIAFTRRNSNGRHGLHLAPSFGGPDRKIAEIHGPEFDAAPYRAASWGPDGKWMVISDRADPRFTSMFLYRLSIESGARRRLTHGSSIADIDPAASPDGHSVAFVRRTGNELGELYLQQLTPDQSPSGDPIQLSRSARDAHSPAWTPDGRHIVFQSGWHHLAFLARIGSEGGSPVRLSFAGEFARFPTISSRGNRASFMRAKADINIWTVSLGTGGSRRKQLWSGSSTYLDHLPRYSPDGRRVAFVSNRSGEQSIWLSEPDGSRAVRLTHFTDKEVDHFDWAPDGRSLCFRAGGRLYIVQSEGGTPKEAILQEGDGTRYSADGKWWYFASRKTGRREIWKASTEGGTPIQLTRNGAAQPQASLDGKFIYYGVTDLGRSVWRIPVEGGPEEKVIESLDIPMNYVVTEDGIYFIAAAGPDRRSAVRFRKFATGKTETLAELDKVTMWGITVSPDRRTLLYTQMDQNEMDLMLVDNFR